MLNKKEIYIYININILKKYINNNLCVCTTRVRVQRYKAHCVGTHGSTPATSHPCRRFCCTQPCQMQFN